MNIYALLPFMPYLAILAVLVTVLVLARPYLSGGNGRALLTFIDPLGTKPKSKWVAVPEDGIYVHQKGKPTEKRIKLTADMAYPGPQYFIDLERGRTFRLGPDNEVLRFDARRLAIAHHDLRARQLAKSARGEWWEDLMKWVPLMMIGVFGMVAFVAYVVAKDSGVF